MEYFKNIRETSTSCYVYKYFIIFPYGKYEQMILKFFAMEHDWKNDLTFLGTLKVWAAFGFTILLIW